MNKETLSDYCKWLEKNFSPEIMIPELPVIIRLDGNNFSKWTLGLKKPFDSDLDYLLTDLTKELVKETNAVIGYRQSDEITLVLYNPIGKVYHSGKKQKILSKLTGFACNWFNTNRPKYLPEHNKIANFDCRIYQTPTLESACKQLLWRELDATKNSISMVAQSLFPHKQLEHLHSNQLQDKMMLEKGVNWNDLESRFKRGTYIKRTKVNRKITEEELSLLPPKHNARLNPDAIIERHIIERVELPIFNRIANKVDVIFNDATPFSTDTIYITDKGNEVKYNRENNLYMIDGMAMGWTINAIQKEGFKIKNTLK